MSSIPGAKFEFNVDTVIGWWSDFCLTDEGVEMIGMPEMSLFANFNWWLKKRGKLQVRMPIWRKAVQMHRSSIRS
jgi:hypothetical protein